MTNSWSRRFLAWRGVATLQRLAVATSIALIAGCAAQTAPAGTPSIAPSSMRPTTKPPVMTVLPDPGTYADGVLDGTWDLQLSEEQVESLKSSFSPEEAAALGLPNADTKVRLGFSGNTWWLGFVFDDEVWLVDGVPEGDGGVFSVDGDELMFTNFVDGWITFRWSITDDELTLTELGCAKQSGEDVECEPGPDFLTAVQTYTFSGSDASY